MEVKTLLDLIDWSHRLHSKLAGYLTSAMSNTRDERTRMLLAYMADHESDMARMVAAFREQADSKALNTYLYDWLPHKPVTMPDIGKEGHATSSYEDICQLVFRVHEAMIDLYRSLADNAVIPEAESVLTSLLAMEEYESRRLVQQTGRMQDL